MSPSMLLSQLLPDVALAGHDPVLTGLVLDSRAVRPGNAFVAIAGFGAHGLGFVEQARAARQLGLRQRAVAEREHRGRAGPDRRRDDGRKGERRGGACGRPRAGAPHSAA